MKYYKTSILFQKRIYLEEFHNKYLKEFNPRYLTYYDEHLYRIFIVLDVKEELEGDLLCISLQAGLNITSIDALELEATIRRRTMQPLDMFIKIHYL